MPEALAQCEEFVSGQMRDRQVQGLIVCKIAQLRAMNGDFDIARAMCRAAGRCSTIWGRAWSVSTTSSDLGMIELLAGDPAAAERALRPDYDAWSRNRRDLLLSTMAAGSRAPCASKAATTKRSS